jgi:transposase
MQRLPLRRFHTCVRRYNGDHRIRTFSCLDQFRAMAFAQLTFRESLRDIEACLRAVPAYLYHMGFRSKSIARTTMADANEKRDWRIFADFAQLLIAEARKLYADQDLGLELNNTVYALDSTTIDLCLSLFPWAKFRQRKGAVKLHTLMNLRGSIPEFILISHGKMHDVNVLDHLFFLAGAYYIMDRGYIDFERLYVIDQAKAFFVIRAQANQRYRRLYSAPADKTTGVQSDQTIVLTGPLTRTKYPAKLRRVRYYDAERDKRLVFLTNDFELPALTIAMLYKARWQIELFFKWIKQHLRIKSFFGTSENAVKTQIWIAVSVYVLVAIIKKHLALDQSLYTILQILSLTLFEKRPILQVFSDTRYIYPELDICNQLKLFDF